MKKLSPREIKQLVHVFMAEIRDECRQADSNILPLDSKGEKKSKVNKQAVMHKI